MSDIDVDSLLKNLPNEVNDLESRSGKHVHNELGVSAAPALPPLPPPVSGTGAFIAKAVEAIDDLNTIVAISGQDVQDTREAKKHLVQVNMDNFYISLKVKLIILHLRKKVKL